MPETDEVKTGPCWFCAATCSDEDFCYGCREYICSACDLNENRGFGSHSPYDHKDLDEGDDDDE